MHPHKPHYDRHAGTDANKKYLHKISRERIDPPAVASGAGAADLIDSAFLSYNAGRLREGCQLFARKMLAKNGTVGLSLSGALTPAGLGMSCLVPLVEAGFVDWIVSHRRESLPRHALRPRHGPPPGRPNLQDFALRENQVIRIYDIVFDYENLLDTDPFYRDAVPRHGVPEDDGHRRVPLPRRQVPRRARGPDRPEGEEPPRGRVSRGRADLHQFAPATARSA